MGRAAGQNSPVNSISLSRGNGTPKQYCTQKKRLTRIFYKRSQGQAALERQMGEHPDFQFTSKNLQAGVRSRHRFGAAMLKRSPWCQDGGRVRIVAFRPGNLETGTSVLQISARGDDPRWSYGPPAVAGSPEAVVGARVMFRPDHCDLKGLDHPLRTKDCADYAQRFSPSGFNTHRLP